MTAHYIDTLRLAVIEGKWAEKFGELPRNISVKPMFDFLSDILKSNQHAYQYEMVSDLHSLQFTIQRICQDAEIKIIYIGTHGTKNTIDFINERVNYKIFGDMIVEQLHRSNKKIDGLYLGACLIGNKRVAKYILEKTSNIKWIAGYSDEIDFTISSCFDLLFFRHYYYFYRNTVLTAADAMHYMDPFLISISGLMQTKMENQKDTERLSGNDVNFDHREIFPHPLGLGFGIFKSENGRIVDALRDF
ncbi:hypothetical protein [uncultured Rhodoblastus sp.]|uniref:hypothetical protein n=1 Tax=uncultured Rhodoblastus sp. TaxID=543037 RepID=UPI0025F8E298|nr:hypothetical protein [uncultured Rhodoblastus sp.]